MFGKSEIVDGSLIDVVIGASASSIRIYVYRNGRGTTIEAVKTLEIEGTISTVIKWMDSCIEKSIKMSNK